jgi:ABC-type sugar transport system substrate-binding protein
MRNRIIGSVVGLCLVLAVGACGSDDEKTPTSANSGATTAAATPDKSSDLEAVKAQVTEDMSGKADFPAPTAAFDPGSKKLMIIACGLVAPVCVAAAKEADTAAKAMGWTTSGPQDGKLSPQDQAGLVTKAVEEGYGGIVMYGVDANSIKAAVDRAIEKKIPVGCMNCDSGPLRGNVIDTEADFVAQGEQMGRYLIAKNEGKAKVAAFFDKAYPSTVQRTEGVEKALSSGCPDCSFDKIAQSAAETVEPGPPSFTALLSKSPEGSLTDAVALYDGIGVPMAKTLTSQGRKDVTVSGYDGDEAVLQGLSDGSIDTYGATIATPVSYLVWSAVDLVGRSAAGEELWDATTIPTVTVTKDNASTYLDAEFEPEGDWQATFKKLWGSS